MDLLHRERGANLISDERITTNMVHASGEEE